jgi:hypothetical protein
MARMKNIDVEIYFSQLRNFFENNPNDLISLIGKNDRDIFYDKLKDLAYTNYEKGDEIQLTNHQLMGVVLEVLDIDRDKPVDKTFFETKFGKVCMN